MSAYVLYYYFDELKIKNLENNLNIQSYSNDARLNDFSFYLSNNVPVDS